MFFMYNYIYIYKIRTLINIKNQQVVNIQLGQESQIFASHKYTDTHKKCKHKR